MSRRKLISITVVGVILITYFLQSDLWLMAVGPIQKKLGEITGFGYAIAVTGETGDIVLQENESLKVKVQELEMENTRLRELANLPKILGHQLLGVQVIGRKQDEVATVYMINRGISNGLTVGMPLVSGNILVGIITATSQNISEFALVTSPLAKINAEVINTDSSRGIVEGEFNLALRLRYLPSSDSVQIGQPVITSGLDLLTPRGLVVGTIAQIEKVDGQFFQEAVLAPPLDASKILFLNVITK